jgi:hypothetical protein
MARSFIDPSLVALATQPAAPPWDWNPGATFVTAFNDAQRNKREQEKMALEMELAEILLPQKRAEAEFNLKKLAYDTERLTLVNKLGIEEIEAKRRFLKTNGLGFGGNTSSPTSSATGGLRTTVRIPNRRAGATGIPATWVTENNDELGLPDQGGFQSTINSDTLVPPAPEDP